MGRLIDSFKAYITDDATATAADVLTGKTAYVSGGKVTGVATGTPLDTTNGVIFDFTMPVGAAGAYTPVAADATIIDSGATLTGTAGTLTAAGLFKAGTGSTDLMLITGLPAKTTSIRQFVLDGYIGTINSGTYAAPQLKINYTDFNNNWHSSFTWDTVSAFRAQIWELTSATGYERDWTSVPTSVDYPLYFQMIVQDIGDRIAASFYTWEPAGNTAWGSFAEYYQVSRNHKSVTSAMVSASADSANIYIQSLLIKDLP